MCEMKRCSKCGCEKPITCFPRRAGLANIYRSKCRDCYNEARRVYERAKPEGEKPEPLDVAAVSLAFRNWRGPVGEWMVRL